MAGPGFRFVGDEERAELLGVIDRWQQQCRELDDFDESQTVRTFERTVAEEFGVAHCLAVNSGTSALLAALAGLGIGPGDEVIVPGYMFVASIAAVVYSGAVPVLAEIDESLTVDPADVRAKITPRTRAIMPVHMLGGVADLAALRRLADDHGLHLLEDCAQATGASYRGQRVGTLGAAGTFSLNHYKVITALDGGFLLTDDDQVFQRAYSFHDHGWFPYREDHGQGQLMLGMNLRMSEFNAAVALAQFAKLDKILSAVRAVKQALVREIGELDGVRRRPLHDPDGECGTLAVYVFDSPERARAVAERIGTRTLIESPKHYYGGLPALVEFGRGNGSATPFRTALEPSSRRDYAPGTLPRTDDILSRAIALAVGVSDAYLGSGFGVSATSGPAEIAAVAARFRAAVIGSSAATAR